jgi:hypothetical protein
MSSTPDREHQDDAAPATGTSTPGTEADAATTSDAEPARTDAAEAPTTPSPATAPTPAGTPTTPAPATTPSRGTSGHRASRPAPVPPAPEDPAPPVLPPATAPTTAVVSDGSGAPTAPLPAATGTPPAADRPTTAPTAPVPPAEAVRRTSFRGAEARAAAVLVTGTSATADADDPFAPAPDALDAAALPGTGPSDASVPYGDPSAPATPREPLPAVPAGAALPAGAARHEAPVAAAGSRSRRDAAAEAPARRPGGGVGRHLAGVLVGLLVGAVGVWTVVFGQSRVLAAQAPGWDASYDVVGVLLVTVGVLVLAVVLGLGLWTPAVPLTAGLVASVVGVVLLYVPATTHVDVVRWFATDATRGSVVRATVTATSGAVFVVGALLLVAGLVLAVARRRWLPRV